MEHQQDNEIIFTLPILLATSDFFNKFQNIKIVKETCFDCSICISCNLSPLLLFISHRLDNTTHFILMFFFLFHLSMNFYFPCTCLLLNLTYHWAIQYTFWPKNSFQQERHSIPLLDSAHIHLSSFFTGISFKWDTLFYKYILIYVRFFCVTLLSS